MPFPTQIRKVFASLYIVQRCHIVREAEQVATYRTPWKCSVELAVTRFDNSEFSTVWRSTCTTPTQSSVLYRLARWRRQVCRGFLYPKWGLVESWRIVQHTAIHLQILFGGSNGIITYCHHSDRSLRSMLGSVHASYNGSMWRWCLGDKISVILLVYISGRCETALRLNSFTGNWFQRWRTRCV